MERGADGECREINKTGMRHRGRGGEKMSERAAGMSHKAARTVAGAQRC